MLGSLFSWLNPLRPAIDALQAAYASKLAAQNDAARIAAEEQIAFFQGQINLAQTAAVSDSWWSPRVLMGYFATAYVGKIMVFDTVFKLGVTPDPGPQVSGLALTIVGFYYGSKTVSDLGGKLLATWATKSK